jgi:hypothetical protein
MIGYTAEQLLRPAKHLTTIPGSCESRSGKPKCLGCGKQVNLNNPLKLCRSCARQDPEAIRIAKIGRRSTMGSNYEVAPYDPERPNCFYCVNYRNHSCAFGIPESYDTRLFAIECNLFTIDERKTATS